MTRARLPEVLRPCAASSWRRRPTDLLRWRVGWVGGDIETLIGLEDMEAVEVYRGHTETPPQFGGMHPGVCGAIVIGSKRRG